jgi:proline racemase
MVPETAEETDTFPISQRNVQVLNLESCAECLQFPFAIKGIEWYSDDVGYGSTNFFLIEPASSIFGIAGHMISHNYSTQPLKNKSSHI